MLRLSDEVLELLKILRELSQDSVKISMVKTEDLEEQCLTYSNIRITQTTKGHAAKCFTVQPSSRYNSDIAMKLEELIQQELPFDSCSQNDLTTRCASWKQLAGSAETIMRNIK